MHEGCDLRPTGALKYETPCQRQYREGGKLFATIVIAIIPAANFSGLLVPVSSLSGGGRVLGLGFPSAWYQPISVGTFTKALGFDDLWLNLMMLAIFFVLYLVAAKLILRKQET